MRIRACTGVAIAVLAVCGVNAASAQAVPPKRHPIGRVTTPVVTDGARYALMQSGPLSLTLIDTRSGRRRAVPLPASPQCFAASGHRGLFLVNCMIEGTDNDRPYLLTARTDTLQPIIGEGESWEPLSDSFGTIGTQWLQGVNDVNKPIVEYLNWHTGERRFAESPDLPVRPRNLDSPGLRSYGPPNDDALFQVVGPYTLSIGPSGLTPLWLHRRGGRTVRVDRCDPLCYSATIGGGWVTWASTYFARAYSVSSGLRLTWQFRTLDGSVVHTAYAVFATIPVYTGANLTGYRAYEAALPRHPAKPKHRR